MRTISDIANEIQKDWKNLSPHAEPYLKAMKTLQTASDRYFCDPAPEIILYFLSNASSWRGETAKRVKKELKDMLKA